MGTPDETAKAPEPSRCEYRLGESGLDEMRCVREQGHEGNHRIVYKGGAQA